MIEIVSRWDSGKVLYRAEGASDVRSAVKEAVKSGANLRGAYLSGANLSGANLRGAYLSDANLRDANLRGANLRGAYLRDANLTGANLTGAYLTGAYLRDANLRGAYLSDANLTGAYLTGAYLSGADLSGADLRGAYLSDANLSGAKGIHPSLSNDLLLLLDQPGKVRAYKLVTSGGHGPFNGGIRYEVGQSYEVPDADTDPARECSRGIHLATLPWCLRNWRPGYRVLLCEFSAKDIAAIPVSDGKFRVRRVKVVREYAFDPVELGLVRAEEKAA